MGRPKQILQVGGRSLLRRAAEAGANTACCPLVVVLGAHAELLKGELSGIPAEIAINLNWERGIGSSIRCGIQHLVDRALPLEAVLISLCDQPLVSDAAFRRLITAHRLSGRSVTVSTFGDTLGPPVVVGAEHFPSLLSLPDGIGAKHLWESSSTQVERVSCPESDVDVDTPEDYARIVRAMEEYASIE